MFKAANPLFLHSSQWIQILIFSLGRKGDFVGTDSFGKSSIFLQNYLFAFSHRYLRIMGYFNSRSSDYSGTDFFTPFSFTPHFTHQNKACIKGNSTNTPFCYSSAKRNSAAAKTANTKNSAHQNSYSVTVNA